MQLLKTYKMKAPHSFLFFSIKNATISVPKYHRKAAAL
jgi:hypothetical protein